MLENKLIGNADDSTLMAVVPGVGVILAESRILHLVRGCVFCDLCGMKLNVNKTKTMIVSRSRTMHPQSPTLTTGGAVLKESDDMRVSFDPCSRWCGTNRFQDRAGPMHFLLA